ncbi:hypothetical protein [Polaribacter sp. HL-MS24]|uniref:hypothetical protein n=1 Tax=Polaribacter sp. HL-MS24 TaxID=3077735 RepID=UPI0029343BC6|nr:hypothetical protein [Polaribacter sp. HL-MS24]WOC39337.1 hypothetical protein RRF69_06480 [Polaribacter sp. HL-MS24]
MKTRYLILLLMTNIGLFAQKGIGTNNPSESAVLELSSTQKGFLPPRMTQAQMLNIANPVEGLMVYCTNCTPAALYMHNGTEYSALLLANQQLTVSNCTGFSETLPTGPSNATGVDFRVEVTNSGFAPMTFTPNISDLTLSGAGLGTVTVSGVSPSPVSLTSGQSQVITFSLSGVASTTGGLAVNGDWSRFGAVCSNATQTEPPFTLTNANTSFQTTATGTFQAAIDASGNTINDLISEGDLADMLSNSNSDTLNEIAGILGITLQFSGTDGTNLIARRDNTTIVRYIIQQSQLNSIITDIIPLNVNSVNLTSGWAKVLIFK